jgi:hypothetical protein
MRAAVATAKTTAFFKLPARLKLTFICSSLEELVLHVTARYVTFALAEIDACRFELLLRLFRLNSQLLHEHERRNAIASGSKCA